MGDGIESTVFVVGVDNTYCRSAAVDGSKRDDIISGKTFIQDLFGFLREFVLCSRLGEIVDRSVAFAGVILMQYGAGFL